MNNIKFLKILRRSLIVCLFLISSGLGQVDSLQVYPGFDSQLLRLKVPEAFQKSSLKLEVFADSTWQLYRGSEMLDFIEALQLLGQDRVIEAYQEHAEKASNLQADYRSRRVFSMISGLGGAAYVSFIWSKGWVYHIPGYAAMAVAMVRYLESRKIEVEASREQYYLQTLISPSKVQTLVDDYNFQLYKYLSTAGIHFSDS